MAKLAFLGTGLIGSGLAEAAAKRGEQVVAYNRTAAKAQALVEHGVTVAESPASAVAGVDRVHITLSDDAAVDSVLEACLSAVGEAVIVDHSTTSPAGTRARAQRLSDQGVAYLHAPVFMSPAGCRSAQGMMLAAGPQAIYAKVTEGLISMTGTVKYLGERSDLAAAYKLFGNAMIIALIGGLADVFTMASELDITAPDALALFESFNPSMVLAYRGRNMSHGDYAAAFELTMARKDVRLMIESAGSRPLSVLPALAERMDQLIEAGHGADDLGVLSIEAVPKVHKG